MRELKKDELIYVVLAWALVGVLIVSATYFSYANGFKKIGFSIQNNYINELSHKTLRSGQVNDGVCGYKMRVHLDDGENNYLRVKAKNVGSDEAILTIQGLDDSENTIYSVAPVKLVDGYNDIPISNQEFTILSMVVTGVDHPVMERAEFRQSIKEYPLKDALAYMIAAALLYALLTAIALMMLSKIKVKTKRNDIKESSIDSALYIGGAKRINYKLPISGTVASRIRVLIWFLMIAFSLVLQMQGRTGGYKDYCMQFINAELIMVMLLIITMHDKDYRSSRQRADLSMFWIISAYVLYTFASDLLVDKIPAYAGMEVFIVLTIYAYVWQISTCKEKYLKEIETAVHLFLIFLVIITLMTNRSFSDARYSGPVANSSIFALYLASIWAVLMASLEDCLRKKNRKKMIILGIEFAVVGLFLVLAQALTPMISVGFITGLFAIRGISRSFGKRVAVTITLGIVVLCIIAGVLLLKTDAFEMMGDSRLAQKFKSEDLSGFLSGRDYYYRCYLRRMNILGHSGKPFLGMVGRRILPHNALIQQAYVYGVPILVSYILMMVKAVEKSIKYARKSLSLVTLPLYGISSFLVMSIADNVDRYFIWMPWIMCYMMFVPLLFDVEEREEVAAMDKSGIDVQ